MAYEHKEGYGAMFTNKDKKGDTHPDFKGTVMLAGVVYELAGWKKAGAGGTFLSIKGGLPREKPADAPARKDSSDDPW